MVFITRLNNNQAGEREASVNLKRHLLREFSGLDFLDLGDTSLWLVAHDVSAPVFTDLKKK